MSKSTPQHFNSLFGFLMVIIGFAVGVGSLWRFPYVMGNEGGAYFLLAYVLLIILIGVPLLTAEMALGYHSRAVGIGAYNRLKPGKNWSLLGWLHIFAAIAIIGYTVPVYAWILNFLSQTAMGTFKVMDNPTISHYFEEQASAPLLIIFAFINWALLFVVLKGGLQNGIERWSKILMPILAVIMIGIAILGLMLPDGIEGLKFIFNLKAEQFSLSSAKTALDQAFFAIGIGMLASMVFGAYIKGNNKPLLGLSATICLAIIMAGVLAGLMIFPLVFAYQLEPAGGPGLTFMTLPIIFNSMPYGQLIGVIFYIGFYIAAFTSALAVFEAVISTFTYHLNMTRNKAIGVVFGIVMIIGLLSTFNNGIFNFLDQLTSGYLIVLGALFITIFVGWIWGTDNLNEAAHIKHPIMKLWMHISIKYVCPVIIILLLINTLFSYIR